MRYVRVKTVAGRRALKGWKGNLVGVLLLLGNLCYGAPDPATSCADAETAELTECARAEPVSSAQSEQLAELTEFLESWLKAWGKGDVDAYFWHYVGDQSPIASLSRPQWEKQRKRSIAPGRNIQVSIELESMGINGQNVIDVVFLQRYSATGYQDLTKKRIYLVRRGNQLKIIREEVLD